jgi:hypothetical protein
MPHQLTLEIPDEVYEPLAQLAQATGQALATVANEWLAASARRVLPDNRRRSWIGAFESDVPDAAERHHDYLGKALDEELRGSGE